MKCHFCKGTMVKGVTSYTVNRNGYHLVLDKVPAFLCKQCGEPLFESHDVEVMQSLIKELDNKTEALNMPSQISP